MNPRAKDLRDALIAVIQRETERRETVGVFLSGGFDSWSLVFAARAAGRDVQGHVFHLAGTEPTDLKYARLNALVFDLPLNEIPLWGTQCAKLVEDVAWMKRALGVRTKAEIECVWPFKKALKHVQETQVLLGHEDLYCMTKKVALHMKDRMDDARAEAKEHAANQNAALGRLFDLHGKKMVMPYESDEVRAVFAGANWDDLHKPGDKQPTRDAFPELGRCRIIRQGLQVGDSGIRDAFEKLLDSPYNVTKARSVTAIYNRIGDAPVDG